MAGSARIDELLKKFDENPRRYFAPLANEYRKAGDLEQALALCRAHLPAQPGHMSGHIVYGQALYEARELDEAHAVFQTALGLDPENLIALRQLGDIERERGDLAGARSWYARVLEVDPRNLEVQGLVSELDIRLGGAAGEVGGHASEEPTNSRPVLHDASEELGLPPVPFGRADIPEPSPEGGEHARAPEREPVSAPPAKPADVLPATAPAAALEEFEPTSVEALDGEPSTASGHLLGLEHTAQEASREPHDPGSLIDIGQAAQQPSADDRFRLPAVPELQRESSGPPAGAPSEMDATAGDLELADEFGEHGTGSLPSETARGQPPLSSSDLPLLELEPTAEFDAREEAAPSDLRTDQTGDATSGPAGEVSALHDMSLELGLPPIPFEDPALQEPPAPAGTSREFDVSGADTSAGVWPAVLAAEPDGPRGAQEARAATGGGFVTETMAELYLRQGFTSQALDVFEKLVRQHPGDDRLRERLAHVRTEIDEGAAGRDATTEGSGSATSARDFFAQLATARPGRPARELHRAGPESLDVAHAAGDVAPGLGSAGEYSSEGPVETTSPVSLPAPSDDGGSAMSEAEAADAIPTVESGPSVSEVAAKAELEARTRVSPAALEPERSEGDTMLSGLDLVEPIRAASAAESPNEGVLDTIFGAAAVSSADDDMATRLAGAFAALSERAPAALSAQAPSSTPDDATPVTSIAAQSLSVSDGAVPEATGGSLGRAVRPATSELSLESVLGGRAPAAEPPTARRPAFSFDQFFEESAAPAAPGGTADPNEESADIAQFNAWLEGLKRK